MICGTEPTNFLCLRATAPDPDVVSEKEFHRPQDYTQTYRYYLEHDRAYNVRTPLSDAFYSEVNLKNLKKGVEARVQRKTGMIPLLEFDRDDGIQQIAADLVRGNSNLPWDSQTLDAVNRAFVGTLETNVVLNIHAIWRKQWYRGRPHRFDYIPYPKAKKILARESEYDMNQYNLTHPIARYNKAYTSDIARDACRPGDFGPNANVCYGTLGHWYNVGV